MAEIKLEVSIREDGVLLLRLPGTMGQERSIAVGDDSLGSTARRVLEAQANGEAALGLDGGPTTAQVEHWTKHGTWPKAGCRWCIAEGRFAQASRAPRVRTIASHSDGTVIQIRRLSEAGKVDINLDELFGDGA